MVLIFYLYTWAGLRLYVLQAYWCDNKSRLPLDAVRLTDQVALVRTSSYTHQRPVMGGCLGVRARDVQNSDRRAPMMALHHHLGFMIF